MLVLELHKPLKVLSAAIECNIEPDCAGIGKSQCLLYTPDSRNGNEPFLNAQNRSSDATFSIAPIECEGCSNWINLRMLDLNTFTKSVTYKTYHLLHFCRCPGKITLGEKKEKVVSLLTYRGKKIEIFCSNAWVVLHNI